MANRRQSIKKIRVDKRRHAVNLAVRTELKSVTRKVRELLSAKKKTEAEKAVRTLFSKLDKAVKKNILHRNRASRLKSRFHVKVKALAASK
jgi:small subunit ribosomal protein S20